jgi:AbrB family looped-hinge helix DNA binding protein
LRKFSLTTSVWLLEQRHLIDEAWGIMYDNHASIMGFRKELRMARQKSVVQKRGQVTIPSDLRRDLGIEPGDEVVFRRTEEGILITTEAAAKLARLNQLLLEMNELLEERGRERGQPYTPEEMLAGIREERGKILKEEYGLDYEDD